MANISFNRLHCITFTCGSVGGRVFNYDGASDSVGGDRSVLNIIEAQSKSTWDTAINCNLMKGDFILVLCTDGSIPLIVQAIDPISSIPALCWLHQNSML